MKTTILLSLAAASASAVVAAPQSTSSSSGSSSSSGPLAALGPLVSGLSSACVGTFGSLALNSQDPLNQCLSLTDAIGTFTTAGTSSSLLGPLNSYLSNDICGKAPCSAATLDGAKAKLSSSCTQEDFAQNNGTNAAAIFEILLQEYWTIHDAACLADTRTNQNCVIETGYAVQNASNYQFSLSNILSLGSNEQQLMSTFEPLLKNKDLTCSDCNKAILSSAFKSLGASPDAISQMINSSSTANSSSTGADAMTMMDGQLISGVQQLCGASFFDGQIPSTVKNTSTPLSASGSGSSTNTNAATSAFSKNAGAAMVALVGAGAMLLA